VHPAELYKQLTDEELAVIFQGCDFKTTPFHRQAVAMAYALDGRDRCCLLMDIGLGKTLVALYLKQLWGSKRMFVVCPRGVIRTWCEQAKKHTDLKVEVLTGSTKVRRKLYETSNADLLVINYEGLKHLFGKKVPVIGRDGKERQMFVPDKDALGKCDHDFFVADEVHHFKGSGSVQTEIGHHLSRSAQYALTMTGSPIGNTELDLWGEYWVLDGGRALGDNFYSFRNRFFYAITLKGRRQTFKKWILRDGALEQMMEKIAPITLRYDWEECGGDLLERTYEQRHVPMSPTQQRLTRAVLDGLIAAVAEGKVDLKNVINKSIKLAQITGGFIKGPGGVVRLKPGQNPKLQDLLQCIREVRGKVIIYHHFVEEGRLLELAFKRAKIQFRSVRGEIKDKDKQVDGFVNNPKVKALIAHPACGGEGLNLQDTAHTVFFFSNTYSGGIVRPQAEGRVFRTGQKHKCVFVDFMVEHSIDEVIYAAMMGKKDAAQRLLNWLREQVVKRVGQ